MLGLLFADQAFDRITQPADIFRLRIEPRLRKRKIPLKAELADLPLFRRYKVTVEGSTVSQKAALTDSTLYTKLIKLGRVTSMEMPTSVYTFRRGGGEALDSCSMLFASTLRPVWLTVV